MSNRSTGQGDWRRHIAALVLVIACSAGLASNASAAPDEGRAAARQGTPCGWPVGRGEAGIRGSTGCGPEFRRGPSRAGSLLLRARRVCAGRHRVRGGAALRQLAARPAVAGGDLRPPGGGICHAAGWAPFFYGETGVGNYRQNSTESTDIFGGGGNYDTFLPIRVGGGWSTALTERHSFNGTLDYRFRWYDDCDRRNDSDLRWNFNLSRPVDEDSLRFGMRGRVSYRGDGRYRNDWGVFAAYDLGFGPNDRVTIGGEVRERRYPRGPLRAGRATSPR